MLTLSRNITRKIGQKPFVILNYHLFIDDYTIVLLDLFVLPAMLGIVVSQYTARTTYKRTF